MREQKLMRSGWLFAMISIVWILCNQSLGMVYAEGKDSFTIVEEGNPISTIIIGKEATIVEEFAASELQKYIKKISGASMPIVRNDEKGVKGNLIIIGTKDTNKRIKKIGIRTRQLKEDGFIIKTVKDNLVISGSNDRGTLYGVYALLEKIGCLFFAHWEVVPKSKTIHLGGINLTEEPDFKFRGYWSFAPGAWDKPAKYKLNCLTDAHPERWTDTRYQSWLLGKKERDLQLKTVQ